MQGHRLSTVLMRPSSKYFKVDSAELLAGFAVLFGGWAFSGTEHPNYCSLHKFEGPQVSGLTGPLPHSYLPAKTALVYDSAKLAML